MDGVTVSSAGTSTLDGLPASGHSVEVAERRGIDISGHHSRLLNASLVRSADLIVTMGEKHQKTIGVIEPEALAHTVLLTDFSPEHDGDVPDPIGGGLGTYDDVYNLISTCVSQMVADLGRFDGWRIGEEE